MDRRTTPQEAERVVCFDAATGKLAWEHKYAVDYNDLPYGNGPRTTPTVFDGRAYTLGALGHLHCLDAATGDVHWAVDLVEEYNARVPLWGLSASPVVFEDLLIVHAGGQPDGSLMALDRMTGEKVWSCLPDPAGYSTPMLIETGGRNQLVCWTPANVRSVDPRTGEPFWDRSVRGPLRHVDRRPDFSRGNCVGERLLRRFESYPIGPAADRRRGDLGGQTQPPRADVPTTLSRRMRLCLGQAAWPDLRRIGHGQEAVGTTKTA